MASTASTPSDMHGLSASQLSELQGAVQALDAYMLLCVDDLRNNRLARPNTKHVADCLVRELARNVGQRFQVKPIPNMITLHHRTKLLTRRVRAVMSAFNKNPNYLDETPNITWDDSFVPPELYDKLKTEKARESQMLKLEEQMAKEKANTTQNDKGKAKETAQDKNNFDKTENPKKWTRETSESSPDFYIASENEEGTSSDESEPLSKRVKCKETIDNVGNISMPPPCRRCTISQIQCKPNGWHAACKNCRKARQTCSLSKALPKDNERAKETAEDNEKPDDAEKPRTQRFREIHTSIYTLTKSSILDDRSSIEDEDEIDQLDEVPTKSFPKVPTTTMEGFIPNDPKCERCEEFHKECVRRETQDHGAKCTQCDKSKKGCKYLTNGQTKINFIPNNPKCDNCKQSDKECVRRETQDHDTACRQCAKDKKGCNLSRGGQSKINFIPNDPKCERCERSHKECVRKDTQDRGSRCKQCVKSHQMCQYLSKSPSKTKASSSSSNSNFDLELMRQQLKASQEDFRIAQQQLQLANSRIEAQRELYEAQLAGYRRRVV